ncbi:MAG: asparagine synthetase B [Lachnospiraceae bacterium]|nr:asparagine synthetase B [Lachnospiraceae bacterium]
MADLLFFGGYLCNAKDADPKSFILDMYEKYGHNFADHIYGMFSIGIYDENEEELILVRDRFGSKSLYYYITEGGELLYSQSIKEILVKPGFKKEFNHDALELYLSFSYMPGEDTFFKGLKKLRPGHMLIWHKKKIDIIKYWEAIPQPDESLTLEECADMIHKAAMEAAPDWKINAGETGNFLSGGVDSGYLTALMGSKTTFSAGYEDPEFDESVVAAETAKALNIGNTKVLIEPDLYFKSVPDVMYAMEEPIGDASCIVFYLAAKEAAKHVRVCYSGEGADELFSGYHAYVRRFKQLKEAEENGVDPATLPQVEDFFIGNTKLFHEDEKKAILKEYKGKILPLELARSLYSFDENTDDMTKILLCDLNVWFEGDIMLNAEKMSEAAGLDARTPFLDPRIVEAALKIPSKYRVNEVQTKLAFRKAAENLLPVEIAQRKKIGFPAPARTWIQKEPYLSMIRDMFESETAEVFFNTEALTEMLKEDLIADKWRYIWCIYVFLIWYRRFFE